jgi:hypothetical protein
VQVIQLPVVNWLEGTMASLVPIRGRYLTQNRPMLFDLNYKMFFQQGLRQREFDATQRYVAYLNSAKDVRDATRRNILDQFLGPTWPARFGLPKLNVPFMVFRSLARDLDSIASTHVWVRLREEPDSVEEYL